jgi:hypothetical protein
LVDLIDKDLVTLMLDAEPESLQRYCVPFAGQIV